jgi:hypothetical protein
MDRTRTGRLSSCAFTQAGRVVTSRKNSKYNPSYSGRRGRRIWVQGQPRPTLVRPYHKNQARCSTSRLWSQLLRVRREEDRGFRSTQAKLAGDPRLALFPEGWDYRLWLCPQSCPGGGQTGASLSSCDLYPMLSSEATLSRTGSGLLGALEQHTELGRSCPL